ncbi:MAG TPA: hypothetical protein VMD75_07610 [Candidatus Binataceae bacterium]|jgi:hypothetical protein|nr:hypothetical protein [Candidatus Binataceae bacterium]
MRESSADSSSFPFALCATCSKTVLTYVAFDAAGQEQRACVHCDHAVEGALRWVMADELETLGYDFGAPPSRGCSGGCAGCSMSRH